MGVLVTRRDARTSTTWSIFRTLCRVKTLSNRTAREEQLIFVATAFILIPALSMPMARSRKFCRTLTISKIKKSERSIFLFKCLLLIDRKVYQIILKGLKNHTGPCMDVEIAFSGFRLQHVFIRVKICFIGHTMVRPNICMSFDILSSFNNTATALKHRGAPTGWLSGKRF